MTPPNKPEWIQLTETDSAPQAKKSGRALPALVLAAAMSIVGVGALVAQNGAETPVISSEQGANLSAVSSSASSPAASPATTAISADNSTSMPSATAVTQPGAPKLPGIASMPTGGDDDDDEDDEDEDDDH